MSFTPLQLTGAMVRKFERLRTLEQVQRLDPVEFEHFVGYLYQREGYMVSPTAASGDEGVDLFMRRGAQTMVVQCKRYSGTVGQPVLRDLYGTMIHSGADRAALVTSGKFSRAAQTWAQGKPLDLVDGEKLMTWMQQNQGGTPGRDSSGLLLRMVAVAALLLLCLGGGFLTVALAQGPVGERLMTLLLEQSGDGGSDIPPAPTLTTPGAEGEENAGTDTPPTPDLPPTLTLPSGAGGDDNEGNIQIPRLNTPIVVNGDLGDWPDGPLVPSSFRVFQAASWDGTEDLTANWRLGWTEAGLFVAAIIEDDVHVQTQTGRTAFQGDSLELQIDTQRQADFGPAVSPDDFQVLLSPGDFGGIPASTWLYRGTSDNNYTDAAGWSIDIAAQQTATGYIVEAFIPWADLNVSPAVGFVFGLSLNVTDTDTPGTAVQEVMYATTSNRQHRNPTTWATATLGE